MKVKDILKTKGYEVNTARPNETVIDALRIMIENRVGSLVVIDSERAPVGIITERDIVRLVYKQSGQDWQNLAVSEVMVRNIVVGVFEDDVEYIMKLMTQNRFRHLPIMEDNRLAGIISIGDVVKSLLTDLKTENRYLNDYITGKYPA